MKDALLRKAVNRGLPRPRQNRLPSTVRRSRSALLDEIGALVIAGSHGVGGFGTVNDDVGIGVLGEIVDHVLVRQIPLMPKRLRSAIAVADDHADAAREVKVLRQFLAGWAGRVHVEADVALRE